MNQELSKMEVPPSVGVWKVYLKATLEGALVPQKQSITWLSTCLTLWKLSLYMKHHPCASIRYSFSTITWVIRNMFSCSGTLGPRCSLLCRRDVVLRINWCTTASGSAMANGIVLQPPHSRVNVAMATALKPPILPWTLPVTRLRGHRSSDAPWSASQDT